jgi:hypothetical protein
VFPKHFGLEQNENTKPKVKATKTNRSDGLVEGIKTAEGHVNAKPASAN